MHTKSLTDMVKYLVLLFLAGVLLLCSCDGGMEEKSPVTDSDVEIEMQSAMLSLDGYTVVISDSASESESMAAKALYKALSETCTGISLSDDYDGKQDHTHRTEILVGETNRIQSKSALAECGELEFVIRCEGGKLVIAAKRPDILSYAVDYFLENCAEQGSVDPSLALLLSYAELEGLESVHYEEVYNMNCTRPTEDIIYPESTLEASLIETETLRVSKSDIYTGGPQFIAKLYSEALSRSPSGEEFAAATARIAEFGCTAELLTTLAEEVFASEEYANCKLTKDEACFTLYRAILSRDPSMEELDVFGGNAAESVALLTASAEFADMMQDIIKGPYFWGVNQEERYTGGNVIRASELQRQLASYTVTKLPQGTLVIMDSTLVLLVGATLVTEGEPTHYAKMARFLRSKSCGCELNIIQMSEESEIKSIFIDGNMSAFALETTAGGSNVVISENYCNVTYCRVSDSTSHQNVWALNGTCEAYIAHNLITCYASDHDKTWQDGISCLATASVIEYNDILDATDGAIAVFRYIENYAAFDYLRAQNSIVRHNNLFNAGNSAYVAHDYETVNYLKIGELPMYPANMTGLVSYENSIWTSWRAHYHIVVTFSTVPWQGPVVNDRAFGGSFYNNSSPEGCFALCACGINVDKVTDAAIRGNNFLFYLGDWCRSLPHVGARAYSINEENSSGDFQSGYVNMPIATESANFITNLLGGLMLEVADTVELRGWKLTEGKVTIPLVRFQAE